MMATATPQSRPPAAASRKCRTAPPNEKPPLVAAVTATVSVVSAVASLSRPSPSMIVISLGGSPARPPTASAATGSVGDRAAPSAMPAARPTPGTNRSIPIPVTTAVASTSPMDRLITVRMFSLIASSEEFRAAL